MGIGVLGPLEVDEGRVRLGARDRMVLAALATRPGAVLSADQLADAVWGGQPPASWAKNLQGCISRLRKLLGAEVIETTPAGYRLLALDALDKVEFERLTERTRELLVLGEAERARWTAGQALALWRGQPLRELEEWEPATVESARLHELRLELEELELEASLRAGHHPEVRAAARAMVDRAPLRERRWTLLALAQYRAGQQAEALRTLHRLRVVMTRDLGLDPGPDAAALEQAILRQDPGLAVAAAPATESAQCPYLGLRPYDEDDADTFFGRDRVVDACLSVIDSTGFLAVVGPSGSGKSSLLRAGLAPALRRRGLDIRVLTPGRRPSESLSVALAGAPPDVVVVVDQAEEVFALCEDEAEREEFLDTLLSHVAGGIVVVGLRADRTGDLAGYPAFARWVEQSLYLLGAMTGEELRRAVEGPARQAGVVVEPGLVDLLLREVEGKPGALPLLSHALRETWVRREGRTLTVAGYHEAGGIQGAVAQSAETLYQGITEPDRELLRELLLRLVAPGDDGDPVRQRLARHQFLVDPRQERLVDLLIASRLVTSDDGVVELAHEALARAWPRLRSWLEEDVEGQRLLHHLALAANDWDRLGRSEDELYRGARLAAVQSWLNRPELTEIEHRFLAASLARRDADERATAERARAQTRLIRRLRVTVSGAAVLLVLALVAGVLALGQAGRANLSADQASRSAESALARQLSAQALSADQVTLAALLAVAAVRVDDSAETRASLSAVLSRNSSVVATSPPIRNPVRVILSPDQRRLAVYDQNDLVHLLDPDTDRILADYDLDGPEVSTPAYAWTAPMAFSPDSRTLAIGAQSFHKPTLRLLDGRTMAELPWRPPGLPRLRTKVVDVAWSADGRKLAASLFVLAKNDQRVGLETGIHDQVLVWDLDNPQRLPSRIPVLHPTSWQHAALSADGDTVYTSSPLAAYDVATGHRRWVHNEFNTYLPVRMSPDGRVLAEEEGVDEPTITLFDAHSGARLRRLTQPTTTAGDISFSADSRHVASGSGTHVWVWDVDTGKLEHDFATSGTHGLALRRDGKRVWTVEDTENHVTTWDLSGTGSFLRRIPLDQRIPNWWGEMAPDGRHALLFPHLGDPQEERVIVDLDTGRISPILEIPATSAFTAGSWSPDSTRFADGDDDGVVRILDSDAKIVDHRKVTGRNITDVDYSADGSRLLISDLAGHLRLLDAKTLRPTGQQARLPGPAAFGLLGPDNHTVFVNTRAEPLEPGEDLRFDQWALVDLDTGKTIRRGDLGIDGAFADLSPDGTHAAVSSFFGDLAEVDTRTGRVTLSIGRGDQLAWTPWIAFTADGTQFLTSAENGAVTIYDTATVKIVDQVVTGRQEFTYAQFRPGSSDVAIMDDLGNAYLWDTSPAHNIAFACRIAGRDLTNEEWRSYLGNRPREPVCPQPRLRD